MTQQQNEYMRKWNKINKERINEAKRDRYRNDPIYRQKMILNAKNYRKNNSKKKYEQDKKYKNKNKEWNKQYMSDYFKNNPEKFMKYNRQHYESIGKLIGLDWKNYKWRLLAWSKSVRKRDNNQCQVCLKSGIHAHHILQKQHYPELSLNINNGITLCMEHHNEVHLKGLN